MSVDHGLPEPGADGGYVPGEPASPGRLIGGRYRLVTAIGQGSMGRVWHARDELLDRDVALKEILFPPEFREDEVQQRLLREARSAARLSHPAVATVFDVIGDLGRPWIVMELVRGRSLDRILAEDGPLPPDLVAGMGRHLLAALAAAHAVGVLHRDVKPSNVLLTDGGAVLTDFGVASIDGDPLLTRGGMIMGTPAYSAPERIRGQAATPAADLWSLGLTLYAASEGQGPYDDCGSIASTIAAIATEDPAPPRNAGPVTPAIMALLSRDPAGRPTAEVAMRMLAEAATSPGAPQAGTPRRPSAAQPGSPAGDPGQPKAPGRKPRRARLAATAAACLVVALGISLWALHQSAPHASAGQTSRSLPYIYPPTTEKPVKAVHHNPKTRKQPSVTRDAPVHVPGNQQPAPTARPSSASAHPTLTAGTSAPSPSPSQQPPGCGALLAGQMLDAGQSLTSCNGEYILNMQGDGNLVLRTSSGSAVWDSGTDGTAADQADMQGDGNLVLRASSGSAVWDSATSGHDGAYLVVQNGGHVVIYSASGTELWHSATDGT